VNRDKVKRGLSTQPTLYSHLKGRLDSEAMLEDLGIDVGYRLRQDQIMCHCPNLAGNHLNNDADPSFGFNEEKLAFNCFVCGGGNVVELVQMMRPELDSEDALRYLEQFSDLTPGTTDDLLTKLNVMLHPVSEEKPMNDYPAESLFQYRKIHPYLYERGLIKEIIVEMQVGWDEEHCGIVIPHWFQGKLRGWQTRHLVEIGGEYQCEVHSCNFRKTSTGIEKSVKVPKYKNTTNFPKVNTVYGYDRLKQKMQEGQITTVIIVESPFTALYLMSLGYDNIVATFGQFNVEQGMLFLPFQRIIFWPDNDKAGFENTYRAIEAIARYNRLDIVPVVEKMKGDAADLTADQIVNHLDAAYNSALLPMYGKLVTLSEVQK
jgi:hypothetical protein